MRLSFETKSSNSIPITIWPDCWTQRFDGNRLRISLWRHWGQSLCATVQYFVGESRWQDDAILSEHRRQIGQVLGTNDGVLILDGSDCAKQGKHSVGVKTSMVWRARQSRQLSGRCLPGVQQPQRICIARPSSLHAGLLVYARVLRAAIRLSRARNSTIPNQERIGLADDRAMLASKELAGPMAHHG